MYKLSNSRPVNVPGLDSTVVVSQSEHRSHDSKSMNGKRSCCEHGYPPSELSADVSFVHHTESPCDGFELYKNMPLVWPL